MQRSSSFLRIGTWLCAFALALRLIVAPGYMPVATPHGLEVTLCGSGERVVLDLPGKPVPPQPKSAECAFAGLSAIAVAASLTHFDTVAPVAPVASALPSRSDRPHLGVPAPPPPAIGPPVLL